MLTLCRVCSKFHISSLNSNHRTLNTKLFFLFLTTFNNLKRIIISKLVILHRKLFSE